MKKNKTLLAVIAAVGMGTLGTASAQIALPENKGVTIGLPSAVSEGNKIEQDVAPLMRSIAKKKSEVDLKSLDRELEKMQDDSLKDQIAREKMLLELQQLSSGQMIGQNRGAGVGFQSQAGIPGLPPMGFPQGQSAQEEEVKESVRVLLVYGFQDSLKAKVEMNGVGGYVVQKGDTLPDGRKVVRVTNSFLEVKSDKATERLPVAGPRKVEKNGSKQDLTPAPASIIIPAAPPAM